MKFKYINSLLGLAILAYSSTASSIVAAYNDEAMYETAIAAYDVRTENFEDDTVWGDSRFLAFLAA